MNEYVDSFQNSDGQRIHTIRWLPADKPKAIILLVHGIAEHSGRYRHVAERLTQNGYAIYALDHRGHGQSEGVRAHFGSMDQPVADLEQYYQQVKIANPDAKIFVYGHSMGSLISLLFVLKYQSELAGWICTGSTLHLDKLAPAPLLAFGKLARHIAPKFHLLPLDAQGISRDPAIVAAYNNDPLVERKPTRINIAVSLTVASQQARERLAELTLPILILHGGADTITPPSGSSYLYEHAGSADKTLKIYEGLYHEVHNEPEKEQVLDDIAEWLDKR
jgi:alpha-beta hydrolase superfamily lysophospholipase